MKGIAMKAMLTAATATMMLATPAYANRYVIIVANPDAGAMVSIDLDSIKPYAAYQRAWDLTVIYNPPAKPVIMQALNEYDCKGDRSRTLTTRVYDYQSNFLREAGAEDWSYVAPETGESRALKLACGRQPDADEVITLPRADMIDVFVKNVDSHPKGRK